MASPSVALLDDPESVRLALDPLRRRLLERLRAAASATEVAAELGLARQKVNYHLRALETAGLVELVEERPRRGCTERILRTRADVFVVDPAVLGPAPSSDDHLAAEHLVAAATEVVRDVTRLQATASATGTRLLTFTLETEIGFAAPADVEPFTQRLAEAMAAVVAEFHDPAGQPYRLVATGLPQTRSRP